MQRRRRSWRSIVLATVFVVGARDIAAQSRASTPVDSNALVREVTVTTPNALITVGRNSTERVHLTVRTDSGTFTLEADSAALPHSGRTPSPPFPIPQRSWQANMCPLRSGVSELMATLVRTCGSRACPRHTAPISRSRSPTECGLTFNISALRGQRCSPHFAATPPRSPTPPMSNQMWARQFPALHAFCWTGRPVGSAPPGIRRAYGGVSRMRGRRAVRMDLSIHDRSHAREKMAKPCCRS